MSRAAGRVGRHLATVKMVGQNGRPFESTPALKTDLRPQEDGGHVVPPSAELLLVA
ncbi:MAG TPA: hypothetical protein VHA80_06380 [Solirubrobacterales bacterium]|nr:hypothetical protein [Solirubrobacterales bacterium]